MSGQITTDRDVHSRLVKWLTGITGVTVIKSHQSAKPPNGDYVAVNPVKSAQVRTHEQSRSYRDEVADNEDAAPEVVSASLIEMEWHFSLHAYSEHPSDALRKVIAASKMPQMVEPLSPEIVIHEVSQVRNVPDWLNDKWVPRAQMDIYLRGITRDEFAIDVIEEFSVEIESDRD